MRNNLDFEALHRSGVGFDRAFHLLNRAHRSHGTEVWPPYNILKSSEHDYCIEVAVAGFGAENLDVVQDGNVLRVSGAKGENAVCQYLHRGIVDRDFMRQFKLAYYVWVEGASLANGLLRISLKREIPEAMKPRKIAITGTQMEPATLVTDLSGYPWRAEVQR